MSPAIDLTEPLRAERERLAVSLLNESVRSDLLFVAIPEIVQWLREGAQGPVDLNKWVGADGMNAEAIRTAERERIAVTYLRNRASFPVDLPRWLREGAL